MRAGWLFALVIGVAWGQTAPDTAAELAGIRDNIRTYVDELPRITCTEDTRQTFRSAGAESTETREDSCDTHEYKLLSVQSAATLGGRTHEPLNDASLETSTGFLAALAGPHANSGFTRFARGRVNGRAVSIYMFHAAMPEGFLLAGAQGSFRVPFRGLLYADAATGALVRAEIECVDIPPDSGYIGADVTVDFKPFDVAGRRINLPSHSRVHIRMQQSNTTNEADYSDYRLAEFGTDTRITFGDK